MSNTRILIVEDEPVTRQMIETRLRAAGYSVQSAPSAEAALALLADGTFALLITDLYLDSMDGVDLMAGARRIDPDLELIVLTGGATIDTVIAALDQGAYAYLRKPVAKGELEARVSAALARRELQRERAATLRQVSAALRRIAEPERPVYDVAPSAETALRFADLVIDIGRRRVTVGGRAVPLSAGEFDMLLFFAQRADTVVSPECVVRELLGYRCNLEEARETVKARVHRLRQKIEADPKEPARLVSVRGAGYMLVTVE